MYKRQRLRDGVPGDARRLARGRRHLRRGRPAGRGPAGRRAVRDPPGGARRRAALARSRRERRGERAAPVRLVRCEPVRRRRLRAACPDHAGRARRGRAAPRGRLGAARGRGRLADPARGDRRATGSGGQGGHRRHAVRGGLGGADGTRGVGCVRGRRGGFGGTSRRGGRDRPRSPGRAGRAVPRTRVRRLHRGGPVGRRCRPCPYAPGARAPASLAGRGAVRRVPAGRSDAGCHGHRRRRRRHRPGGCRRGRTGAQRADGEPGPVRVARRGRGLGQCSRFRRRSRRRSRRRPRPRPPPRRTPAGPAIRHLVRRPARPGPACGHRARGPGVRPLERYRNHSHHRWHRRSRRTPGPPSGDRTRRPPPRPHQPQGSRRPGRQRTRRRAPRVGCGHGCRGGLRRIRPGRARRRTRHDRSRAPAARGRARGRSPGRRHDRLADPGAAGPRPAGQGRQRAAPARADAGQGPPAGRVRAVLVGFGRVRHRRPGQLRRRQRPPGRPRPAPARPRAARPLAGLGSVGGRRRHGRPARQGRAGQDHRTRRGTLRRTGPGPVRPVRRRRPRSRRTDGHGPRRGSRPARPGRSGSAARPGPHGAPPRRGPLPAVRFGARPAARRPHRAGTDTPRGRGGAHRGRGRTRSRHLRRDRAPALLHRPRLRLADRGGTAQPAGRRDRTAAPRHPRLQLPEPGGPDRVPAE